MNMLYEKYINLKIDGGWIGLEAGGGMPCFCTPIGAEIIGWDNGIHYCFIEGFGDMVFCVNPVTFIDWEPVFRFPAYNFVYALLSAFSCFTSSRESPEILTISSNAYLPAASIRRAVAFMPSRMPSCKDSFLISSMALHIISIPSLLSLKNLTLFASVP